MLKRNILPEIRDLDLLTFQEEYDVAPMVGIWLEISKMSYGFWAVHACRHLEEVLPSPHSQIGQATTFTVSRSARSHWDIVLYQLNKFSSSSFTKVLQFFYDSLDIKRTKASMVIPSTLPTGSSSSTFCLHLPGFLSCKTMTLTFYPCLPSTFHHISPLFLSDFSLEWFLQ